MSDALGPPCLSTNVRRKVSLDEKADDLDWIALERLYEEGRELILDGRHETAINTFKRIYEVTLELRDVAEVVDDYYGLPISSGSPNIRLDSKSEKLAEQSDAHEPPLRVSVSMLRVLWTLDSLPAPAHGGGR